MQAMLPRSILHNAAGLLVNDLHRSVSDQIMCIALHQMLSDQCLPEEIFTFGGTVPNCLITRHQFQDMRSAGIRELDSRRRSFDRKMPALFELRGNLQSHLIDHPIESAG